MRHPDRGLALLRIVVGLWFLKSVLTKIGAMLLLGIVPIPIASARWIATMPPLIVRYATENPFPWYKAFLLDTVAPNNAFAHLTALGEVGIGLLLTFGLFTGFAAMLGALQVAFYGLAVQHTSPGQLGFHVLLMAMMFVFAWTKAGRTWGLDASLAHRRRVRDAGALRRVLEWRVGHTAVLLALLAMPLSATRAQLVLASNEGSGTVTVIEGTAVVATIEVGRRPRGIDVTADGKLAYVALADDNEVAVIDIAARRVIDRIPVGKDPEQVVVSRDGRTIYVSNEAIDSATAVSVQGHAVVFRVPVGREPEGIAVNPRGTRLYVTGESDSSVTVINASNGQRIATTHVGARPRFMAFGPGATWALVSTEVGGLVQVLDLARDSVVSTIPIADRTTRPTGLAISRDGKRAYVAHGRGNAVSMLDLLKGSVAATIPVGNRPWGVALSPNESVLYVANGRSNSVSIVSTRSLQVTHTVAVGERPYMVVVVPR